MDDTPAPLIIVSTTVDGTCGVVTVSGDIDMASAEEVSAAVTSVVEGGATEAVTLDISGVAFLDSYGIRVVLSSREQVARLDVVGASARVRRMFEIVGLGEVLS